MSVDGREFNLMDKAITKLGGEPGEQVIERVKEIAPKLMQSQATASPTLGNDLTR